MKFTNNNRNIGSLFLLSIVLTLALGSWSTRYNNGYCQERPSSVPGVGNPKAHEIDKNVYAITDLYHSAGEGFGTNAGIIITSKSVVFIDASMSIASGEFLWKVAEQKMKGGENLYLIITHHHADHVFGMRVMGDRGAKIIGHGMLEGWIQRLDGSQYKQFIAQRAGWTSEERDRIFGDVVLTPPSVKVEKDTILSIDGEDIHVLFTPGHVKDELSVYHPKSKTLFAGDAIYEGSDLTTHFGGPNEWKEWISQLERFKMMDIKTIVPGHGKLCTKEEIDRNIAFLKNLLK